MRSNTIQRISCASMAAVLLIVAGCQTAPKDERSEGRALDDKHITENVRKTLESEPTYKFSEVNVSTFAGVVQLSGFVNTDGEKQRAQEIAQNTDGVKQVVNGIALKPMMPATGRMNSSQKIYADPNNPSAPPSTDSDPALTPPKQKD
ncbi:MAG TPA: BON domain-containing protein [Verrucomicrobiae bacterium]|nr:BON domain-containing protein [Verrucomicrobiae bacterium]